MESISIEMGATDSRCRYWTTIVREGTPLPLPENIVSSRDLPSGYLRPGQEELFEGDFWLEGEEKHHRKPRGWSYTLRWIGKDGNLVSMSPAGHIKQILKDGGLESQLLKGSGEVAAMVRMMHGVRAGIL